MKKFCFIFFIIFNFFAFSQNTPSPANQITPPAEESGKPPTATKIDVKPTARDHEIQNRLENILEATGWFINPKVEVKEGVVFLSGETKTKELKTWATELAKNTQDVSAVINKISIATPSIWNFEPAIIGIKELWRDTISILPTLAFTLFIILFFWIISHFVIILVKKIIHKKISNLLLEDIISRSVGLIIILLALYVIFKMLGLTTIAFTIIGGTGVLGIILGIAFRDITENLLASIFLSIHHPFKKGDLIEITEIQGYVQTLTIRSTVIMTLDGNHVEIPNSIIYKNTLRNYSVTPNKQIDFLITIGINESIPNAQEIALNVLNNHPVILKDPEPLILVDEIKNAKVVLHIYCWFNAQEHSILKVKSSVIRLTKNAFQNNNISMPGELHEILIKEEVPVKLIKTIETKKEKHIEPQEPIATPSEASFKSESDEIEKQALQSRKPIKQEQNLLEKNNQQKE